MAEFWAETRLYLSTLASRITPGDLADVLLVAFVVYQVLRMTRDTRGSAVLKGLLLLLVIVGISSLMGFTALNWLLMQVLGNGAVVLMILFQPEIRSALEQFGRGAKIDRMRQKETDEEDARVVEEIVQCMTRLSRRRVGALIVLEQHTGLKDIIDNGISLEARISAGLLENIFEPNTPLHDGAVVIRGRQIMSAACILSLTDAAGVSHDLGTRHRAALGVSETTDAIALIVSEETGIISMARAGKLTRHMDARALRTVLEEVYIRRAPGKQLFKWLPGRTGRKEGTA